MYPTSIACPHCRNAVAFDARFAGHVVSCPYCRGGFQMPTYGPPLPAMLYPPHTAYHASVRVRVSRTGLAIEDYRPMPDVNAVVALFPAGGAAKAPIGTLYTMRDRAQFDEAKRVLEGQSIYITLAGGDGQAILSPVLPGEYHLFIKSATCPGDPRMSAVTDRFFGSDADGSGDPFDFTHDFVPLRQFQQESVYWTAVHLSSIAVTPGAQTDYSHHFA